MRPLQLIRLCIPLGVLPGITLAQPSSATPSAGNNPSHSPATTAGSTGGTAAKRRFVPAVVERLELADGRVLVNARIISESPGFVTVRHAGGMAQVEKAILPAELQEKYPEDLGAMERERARTEADRVQRAEEQAERTRVRIERRMEKSAAQQSAMQSEMAKQAQQEEAAYALAQRELERYFRTQWTPGNNSIFVTGVDVNLEDVEPAQNWPGRWNLRGTAFIEYYLSSGDSFSRNNLRFTGEMIQEGRSVKLDIRAR